MTNVPVNKIDLTANNQFDIERFMEWNEETVQSWLTSIGFDRFRLIFASNNEDFISLCQRFRALYQWRTFAVP
jgi:hypothetical protein